MLETQRVSLRIPKQVYAELEHQSIKTGNSISSLIRSALNEYLYGKSIKEE